MIKIENLSVWDNAIKDFVTKDLVIESNENLIIDGSNLTGIPLGVDLHVHFRDPGYEYKEDLYTGSLAALYGGITTVLDMPNTNPITDSVKNIKYKKELAKKKSVIDVLVAGAITNNNTDEIVSMAKYADAFKVFMSESFGKLAVTYENIEKALSKLENAEESKPVIFHAEDPSKLKITEESLSHEEQRPKEAEAEAIQQISLWAQQYKNIHFHITHLSSELGVKMLELTRSNNITADTCPRYLMFSNTAKIEKWKIKVNPPIRTEFDRKELSKAFAIGAIDMICSDHSPHTIEDKTKGNKEIPPSGMPGVQELLPIVLTMVMKKEISWLRAIEAYHLYPSKLLNINNNSIESGNLLIYDLSSPSVVNKEWIKSKAGWSPYEQMLLYNNLQYVIKNGKILIEKGKLRKKG